MIAEKENQKDKAYSKSELDKIVQIEKNLNTLHREAMIEQRAKEDVEKRKDGQDA